MDRESRVAGCWNKIDIFLIAYYLATQNGNKIETQTYIALSAKPKVDLGRLEISFLCQNHHGDRLKPFLPIRLSIDVISKNYPNIYYYCIQTRCKPIYHDFNPPIRAVNAMVTLYRHFTIIPPTNFVRPPVLPELHKIIWDDGIFCNSEGSCFSGS